MRSLIAPKSKKAQFGIITFVGLMFVLLLLAPFVVKIVRSSVGGFSDAITTVNAEAGANVDAIEDTFINMWDWVIFLVFSLNVLLLLISSFFIDTHPAFVIVYIMAVFFLMMFAPSMADTVETVFYDSAMTNMTTGHQAGALLPTTEFLINNFGTVLLGIIVLSGIIMYAKFKYFT